MGSKGGSEQSAKIVEKESRYHGRGRGARIGPASGLFQVRYATVCIQTISNADEENAAFEPETNPLNVPLVQVSLFNTEDPDQHYRLGQAVASLREQNILIIVSGMAVHNLRDLRFTFGSPAPMP